MRGRSGAWCAAAGLLVGALALVGGAGAEEARRCSPWRAAAKPHERIELRTCREPEPEDDEPYADDGDDRAGERAEAAVAVEIRSGYEDARKIRLELVTAGGAVETLSATVKRGVHQVGPCAACAEHGGVERFRVVEPPDAGRQQGAGAGADELRKVTGTQHMEVLARDLRLNDADAARLKRIAARYYKATRKRLILTGGTRTPPRQARLMYDKLKHGQDIVALYENRQAAVEVRDAYRAGVAKSLPRKRLLRLMTDVIEAQISRGVLVSKHLRAGAVDVRSWDMTPALEQALRDAVKKEPGVTLLDERSGPEPHFHLSLP